MQMIYSVAKSKFPEIGFIFVVSSSKGVTHIAFGKNAQDIPSSIDAKTVENISKYSTKTFAGTFPSSKLTYNDIVNSPQHVDEIIEDPTRQFPLILDYTGTQLQIEVWKALCTIPVGTTVSYSDLAIKVNNPTATRAVANACGKNQHAIIIPCHRVIRKDGSLGGYYWGLDMKTFLLENEKNFTNNSASMN